MTMHPRTQELATHLAATRDELRRAVKAVPVDRREQSPHDGCWTIAEILDHLAKIERMVAGVVEGEVRVAREVGLGAESDDASQLESFRGHRVRRRGVKIESPAFGVPDRGVGIDAAWSALEASRTALIAVLHGSDGLALGSVSAPHQFLGTLNMYQWIAFVGFHEQRHADQISEIGATLA